MIKGDCFKTIRIFIFGLIILSFCISKIVYFSVPIKYSSAEVQVIDSNGSPIYLRSLTAFEIAEIQKAFSFRCYYKAPLLNTFQGTEIEYIVTFVNEPNQDTDKMILNINQSNQSRMIDRTRVNYRTKNCSIYLNREQTGKIIEIIKKSAN